MRDVGGLLAVGILFLGDPFFLLYCLFFGACHRPLPWERCSAVETQGVLRAASLMLGIKDSCGNTVLSRKYIDEHWNNEMVEVVAVIEGIIDFRQDLVILRRKA